MNRPRRGLALVAGLIASATGLPPAAADDPSGRASYRRDRDRLTLGLGAWALASVGAGATLLLASDGRFSDGFAVQQVAWGTIDLGLAVAGVLLSRRDDRDLTSDPTAVAAKRRRLRRIFWINVGLDVLYVAGGAALWALGDGPGTRGTGAGIVAQGGFLLGFDLLGARVMR